MGDTVQITMGQSPDGSTYSNVPSDYILVQGNADLQNGWVSPRIWTSQMTKKADAGDLIMSVRAPAGAMGKTAYNAVIGRGVAAIKGNEFIYQLLVKMDSDGYWKALSCGSTFESLNSDNIKNADVLIPNAAEQKKIGQYFANLDNLITLHQRKYDKLVAVKKALLEKMFPADGETVPKIRFKGFSDAWEQRKVGDLLIERNQQAPMSDEYPLMAFIANEGVAPKGERYDRSSLVTDTVNKLYKKTEKGDFIYSSNNLETGSIGLNKHGKACISPVYSIFEPTGIADSDFLGRRLVRKDFINAMVKWRQGVIYGQWRIHESDFLKIEIPIPSVEEQRKIGAYLDQLDNLITLHQRECLPKTCSLASWFYQQTNRKMTSFWEQRKLEDFFTERNERSGNGEMISVTIGSGIKKFDELNRFDKKPDDLSKYKRVEVGDIAYNSMRMWQGASGYSPYSGILSPAYTVITPKNGVSSRFFAYVLKQPKMIHQFEINSQGLTKDTWNLKFPAFAPIEVVAPLQLAEQEKVSELLLQLDNLITLHQCKDFSLKSVFEESKNFISALRKNTSWEQRKVSEMFKVTRGYVLASTLTEAVKTDKKPYPVYSSQTKDNGLMGYYKDYLYEDAITWTTDGANAGTVNYRAGKFYCTNVCGVLLSNEVTANQMIAEALNNVAKGYVSYVGNPKLMNNVMADIEIMIPTQSEEREKLSVLFRNLDNLITLHQRIKIFFTGDYHDQKNK